MEKSSLKTINLEKEINRALRNQKIKDFLRLRNRRGDHIKLTAQCTFYEGTPECPTRHIASTKGHVVDGGLIALINYLSCTSSTTYTWGASGYAVGGSGVPAVPSIRLGTGGGATVHNTAGLVTIVNTPPSIISGATSNPSAGVYRSAWSCTWNAGVIAALTITEAGLYINAVFTLQYFGQASVVSTTNFFDRVSVADGDFSQFTIDTAKPLSCSYKINAQFV